MKKSMIAMLLGFACVLPAYAEEAPGLSPAVEKAIKDLSANDFSVREKANAELRAAVTAQLRPLLEKENLETQKRLRDHLEFQDGITRWALDTMKLPRDKRLEQMDWALKPNIAPVVAMVYSAQMDVRMEGIRQLSAMKDNEASAMLARLLGDDQREVYIAAMEAVWNRKPTAEVIDALWQRAIEVPITLAKPRANVNAGGAQGAAAAPAAADALLRARALAATNAALYKKSMDNDAATETLIHIRPPQLSEKLDKTLGDLTKDMKEGQERKDVMPFMFMPYNDSARNIYRLIETCRTPASLEFLLANLDVDMPTKNVFTVNGKQVFVSCRTASLVTLIQTTGQTPESFKLLPANNIWSLQWAPGSEAEEAEAISRIKKWCVEHKDEKLPEKPTNKDAPNAPGFKPAAGGAINLNGVGAIQIQGGAIQGGVIQIAPGQLKVVPAVPAPAIQPVPAPAPAPK